MKRHSQDLLTLHTPPHDSVPTFTGLSCRELSENALQALVKAARAQGSTLFSTAYAAALISMLKVQRPSESDKLVSFQWVVPVNLRFKDILTKDANVPSALASYMLEPENLSRFIHNGRAPTVEDVWTLAREIKAQMDEQSPEMKNIAQWGEALEFSTLPPELMQAINK